MHTLKAVPHVRKIVHRRAAGFVEKRLGFRGKLKFAFNRIKIAGRFHSIHQFP